MLCKIVCDVHYSIHAKGYENEIHQALGTISVLTGIRFWEDGSDLVFRSKPVLRLPGWGRVVAYYYNNGVWLTDTREYIPGMQFNHKTRLAVVTHELLHWVGLPHDNVAGSIMNVNETGVTGINEYVLSQIPKCTD